MVPFAAVAPGDDCRLELPEELLKFRSSEVRLVVVRKEVRKRAMLESAFARAAADYKTHLSAAELPADWSDSICSRIRLPLTVLGVVPSNSFVKRMRLVV